MSLGTVKKLSTESYQLFYAKILYLMERNLAPPNKTVDTISTGQEGDKLTVSNMDHAAVIWLMQIDPRLFAKIQVEYAVQIKNGMLLSELVPQIAKAIPGMLKSLDGVKKEVISCIKELQLGDDDDDHDDPHGANINYVGNSRSRRGGGSGRGNQKFNRGGNQGGSQQRRFDRQNGGKPVCNHCNWLKTFWRISEVDANHRTENCTRNIPREVRAIIDEEIAKGTSETSPLPSEEGMDLESQHSSSPPHFQKADLTAHPGQPPDPKAQDPDEIELSQPTIKSSFLSEASLLRIKIRALRLARKAASPRILVTFNNKRVTLLVDEGAEINCIDADFAIKNNIRLESSSQTAKSAGNKDLVILGQAVDDVYVDTLFQSSHVSINLGRATIIKNLGAEMILGEPGKAQNSISTDPKNRLIFADREGKFMAKPYFDQLGTTSSICRVQETSITIFPEEYATFAVPEHLHNSDIAVTPRRGYGEYFEARVLHVGSSVKLRNISGFPVNLKKHDQVADIRSTTVIHLPGEDSDSSDSDKKINLLHYHSEDNFKFSPTVIEQEKPDISKIKVDPQGQMPEEMRAKFHSVNERFKHIFTSTPGRYTGYYGDCDTSLQFTQPPVQTRKVAQANYDPEKKLKLAQKMDELIAAGILMRPEQVGVSAEFISPSLLVPKIEKDTWRLVTDFTHLNKFVKRCSSTSPSIGEAKADLSRKKYFAEVDLANYFFQGGLKREDCAYLAVQHPFKGILVYTASPQGLKNSSEHSYERLGRVYGDLIQAGKMTRMADGLYPMGNSYEELLENYTEVLARAEKAGFTFKPSKCVVAPRSAVIFGWLLQDGEWSPQEHVVSSLSRSQRPSTIKQLRSFLGAYKQLSECIPSYAVLLSDFEK